MTRDMSVTYVVVSAPKHSHWVHENLLDEEVREKTREVLATVGSVPISFKMILLYVRLPLPMNTHYTLYGEVRGSISDHPACTNVRGIGLECAEISVKVPGPVDVEVSVDVTPVPK